MSINCAILAIGSELLEGSVLDTNSNYISKILTSIGVKVTSVCQVADDSSDIISAIKDAARDYKLIFTTGGLGPTFDDITAECVAIASNNHIELNNAAFLHMKAWLDRAGVTMNEGHERQAMLPSRCDLFSNNSGTAMGFGVKIGQSYIISMPGVPYEMKSMFESAVIPFIRGRFDFDPINMKDLHFVGLPESEVDDVIIRNGIPKGVQCIINAGNGEVVVKLRGTVLSSVDDFATILQEAFPDNFIGFDDTTLQEAVFNILLERSSSVAVAESCTGGMLGRSLTEMAGSSATFLGGVISYSNDAKRDILGVRAETLADFGAVSSECAVEMSEGALKLFGSDYSISVTGIAGPGGGSNEKPVGTVFIAVSGKGKNNVKRFQFRGERAVIRERSVSAALTMLLDMAKGQ